MAAVAAMTVSAANSTFAGFTLLEGPDIYDSLSFEEVNPVIIESKPPIGSIPNDSINEQIEPPYAVWKFVSTETGTSKYAFDGVIYGVYTDGGLELGNSFNFQMDGSTYGFNFQNLLGNDDTFYVVTAAPEFASFGIWGSLCMIGAVFFRFRTSAWLGINSLVKA
ncbi:hypothetical protein [Blastopirellula marina]|uniref:Uncharacterized protein n=1 Tax=Blastopirellula marina TaxID=124 RepID=A0A2S8GNH1_9BACT|nr:hypothetical protein [Blastopirellula marina]PQO45975.1 hypothetical protein C5Y93_12040 [Blastopirellula marina]